MMIEHVVDSFYSMQHGQTTRCPGEALSRSGIGSEAKRMSCSLRMKSSDCPSEAVSLLAEASTGLPAGEAPGAKGQRLPGAEI